MNFIGMKNAGFEIIQAEVYNTWYTNGEHNAKVEEGICLGYNEIKEEWVTWEFIRDSAGMNYFWGHYFGWKDSSKAKIDYHHRLLSKYNDNADKRERLAEVHWTDDDLKEALEHCGVDPTKENLDELREAYIYGKDLEEGLTEKMVEAGWEYLYGVIGDTFPDERIPEEYIEVEYPDMEDPEAILGARFDDANFNRMIEQ